MLHTDPDPVARARAHLDRGTYRLGAGGYRPTGPDEPWSPGTTAADCVGFALWCHKIPRHRPGFNRGPWATVTDDVNTDSIIEDATHRRDVFALAPTPAPGDLIVYRSIWWHDGRANDVGIGQRRWIGHVGVIVTVPPGAGIDELHALGVVHCHGPTGNTRAVTLSDGSIWAHHAAVWNDDGAHPVRGAFVVRVLPVADRR